MNDANPARLIGVDWGSTNLRAYRIDAQGRVLEARSSAAGVLNLPQRDFAAALANITTGWQAPDAALPILASGMIGSVRGIRNVPYLPCPARIEDVAAAVTAVPIEGGGVLHIVPGLMRDDAEADIMRGEETETFGALATADPAPELIVLPGTHSKWVRATNACIATFRTHMTGELFAVLREHSLIGRLLCETHAAVPGRAFERGIDAAQRTPSDGLAALLFGVRAKVLTGKLAAMESADYLSGVLIGDELRSAFLHGIPASCVLVGDAALCALYRRAWARFDAAPPIWMQSAASSGLFRIAQRAGLIVDTKENA